MAFSAVPPLASACRPCMSHNSCFLFFLRFEELTQLPLACVYLSTPDNTSQDFRSNFMLPSVDVDHDARVLC